ncbi:equilibrative nucleoside transporter 1 isoform X2 [Belonocnema kinseyi]|uniref:equilibrative nucleoside transporter 1 isoform X2 n=1 Tax=Belonocnema kinseyi TaxID=2817044 RepID=UPI00143D10D8|nr:equilibrative nucleoside transporter 1 isoform X2 [Belonocnema kinseyi]
MAGTYTKKDFGPGPEEQTLLKDVNGARIMPSKGSEPVRLSPGWEGTGRPDDELNFRDMTMDQIDLELNPPKDRLNIVYFIMVLHGLGTLISWNMFITAKDYFVSYKLNTTAVQIAQTGNITNSTLQYSNSFMEDSTLASQLPNLIFSWLNLFVQFGGNLTIRIVWGIFVQVLIFVFTVILAMTDSSTWIGPFYWMTIVSIIILNTANGIYQNSVFGMAAKLPGKYTGAVVLGSNISGTLVAFIDLISKILSPNHRTAAIYYFITALFVLLACFDTYFALPINRFYRYHELLFHKEVNKKRLDNTAGSPSQRPPYIKIFKQCWIQCFNVFFIFFVTLSLFPGVHSSIKRYQDDFIVPHEYYTSIMCFITFNVTAMLGSLLGSMFQLPSPKYSFVPILLRVFFIPLFLVCNYQPKIAGVLVERTIPLLITNDWIYLVIAIAMGLTSGYFSSISMVYCSRVVESRYASTAGMFGAASLVTGIVVGLMFARVMPYLLGWSIFKTN